MFPKRTVLLGTITAVALVLSASAEASTAKKSWRIQRPPNPQPMPQVFIEPCPGLKEASGCHFDIGESDENGRIFAQGAVFIVERDAFYLEHELGHRFDDTMMDTGERSRFLRLMGTPNYYWTWNDIDFNGAVVQGVDTPAEKFADAYANCRLRHEPGVTLWEAGYGYYPRPRQHRRICGMITRAGRDVGYPPTSAEIDPGGYDD